MTNSASTEQKNNQVDVGGWTPFKKDVLMDNLAPVVFQHYINKDQINSRSIQALAVSTQVVAGTNYKFIVSEYSSLYFTGIFILSFYQDLENKIHNVTYVPYINK